MATFSDQDAQPLADEQALAEHIEAALAASPPDGMELDLSYSIVKRLFKPTVLGAENIPDRPCLFIGNHSLFALDGLVLAPIMLRDHGRFLRAMGDKFLFTNPAVADFLLTRGGTMGHPDVCDALMEEGHDILVFPGGAHEAVKPASAMYELQWKERYGFVKLAARHGYTIMPFGLVGPDEFYGHLIEGHELPHTALGGLLKRAGLLSDSTRSDMIPPVPTGALGSLFPKPQACFLGFGQPISLATYRNRKPTKAQLKRIRSDVAEQIEEQLAELLLLREQSRRQDGFFRRLLTL